MLMAMVLTSAALAQTLKNEKHWVSAWSSAMHTPLAFVPGQAVSGLENRTLRMIVRPTIGGERLRIRFSNECGNQPLPIGATHVALVSKDDKIIRESDRTLSFSGKGSSSIPPGAPMLSDPVDLKFSAFAEIAVSIFLAGKAQKQYEKLPEKIRLNWKPKGPLNRSGSISGSSRGASIATTATSRPDARPMWPAGRFWTGELN